MNFLYIIIFIVLIIICVVWFFHRKNFNIQPPITKVSWLPYPRRGMCIPPFGIFTRNTFFNGQQWFIDHEQMHWKQYQELGLWKFYIKYYLLFLRYGYFDHPMEREAREKGGWEDFVEEK